MKNLLESLQILPPWNDDVKFENFITAYFNDFENTTSYDRFGRSGQKQDGLDIYSSEKKTVIQCKLKLISGGNDEKIRDELIADLDTDFNSFIAYNKKHSLSYRRFIFASTFYSDTHIVTECAKKTNDSVSVEYWSWERLKNNIQEKTLRTYYGELTTFLEDYFNQNSAFPVNNIIIKQFKVDETKLLIDQLNDYFKHHFEELNVMPIHLFINNFPFKKSSNFYPYYSLFTLSSDNDELFAFFDSLKIENGEVSTSEKKFIKNVKDSKKKLKFILQKLSENLIFYIENKNSHKQINIRYAHSVTCPCMSCSFGRLDYSNTFKDLVKTTRKIEDKLLQAYMHYELGNFVESAKYFEDIAKQSKKDDQKIRYSIAQYNLSKLYILIRNNYWGENVQSELLKRLKAIDIETVYDNCKTEENKKLLDWIINSKFYISKREKISRTVNKIKDHYYSQLSGGWSSNSYVSDLINDYAEIETFINGNYIIYDRFSEYHDLTDNFIEGLIISHSMNESQSGKLEHFDDWLIMRMIFNGNAEKILKHFSRYELKTLKYKQTAKKGDTFIDILNNHLTKYEHIRHDFEESCEKSNGIFWEKYNSIFSNLLLLSSLCDFEASQIQIISQNLLNYLKNESFISRLSTKYINYFISRQGKHMDKSILYGFVTLYIEKGKFHEQDFIESIIYQIKTHKGEFKIQKETLNKLISIAFDKCNICNENHSAEFIAYIYDVVENISFKNVIKSRIEDSLNNRFESKLYYISAIYNVFDTSDKYFSQFIQTSKPKDKTLSLRGAFTGIEDNRSQQVNMLLNLCFKYELDLTDKLFDDFRNIDDYYLWLFNMKDFDYEKFNPKWVIEYRTKYYFDQFRKYPIIREKIYAFLKVNKDYQLEKVVVEFN